MLRFLKAIVFSSVTSLALSWTACAGEIVLVERGQSRVAVFVPERVMDDAAANPEPAAVWRTLRPEDNRRRLRESVKDFAAIVQRITGANIDVVPGRPSSDDKRLPILIGELGAERFGKPQKSYPYEQGFRIAITPTAIGLVGESDLATSYAIYTLLDQLGGRWFLPSPLGEVLPQTGTLAVQEQDSSGGPHTIYRGIWYCDNDFARRNRLGGMDLATGHALEMTVPKQLREQHPEIRAVVGGKPDPHRVKWTHPLVARAIADAVLDAAAKDPSLYTWSLSPDDGMSWDESDDAKYDAGDFDTAAQTVSKTDRLMVLANRVAEAVVPKHPRIQFGILAYVDYVRPPVREKVHPNVVPQIAPITYSRAHPMSDDGEPNTRALRELVEGWGRIVPATSYYFYGYFLAEVSSPNPMITKWGQDIPYIYAKGRCKYWQPETITNFETSMHAHWLGIRLAWDPAQDPHALVAELDNRFYGRAAREMADYWHLIDEIWVKTPEYAGCGFGHLHRWTTERLAKARQAIDRASAACTSDPEKARVKMASESLEQFELFMKLRRDLADGRWESLADQAKQYRQRSIDLGERYKPQFAFGQMGWTAPDTINVRYFDAFYKATYDDATRIATAFEIVTRPPLRQWRIQMDEKKIGESSGWQRPDFDDSGWRTTDCAVDTWSSLGQHNYLGSMWYRTRVSLPVAPVPADGDASKSPKTYLWLAATDGRVKAFVNGKHIPFVNDKGQTIDSFSGFCQPVSIDISAAVAAGSNQISLVCTREFLNELGTGGLLGPAAVYREKAK